MFDNVLGRKNNDESCHGAKGIEEFRGNDEVGAEDKCLMRAPTKARADSRRFQTACAVFMRL